FFAFASELKIAGQGGRHIEVNELENVEYVRLTASPPRFDRGETLPVVFDIRVAKAPEEFAPPEDDNFNQPGAKRRVRSSFPEDGDVEIPLFTEVEVSFDGNVSELLFDPEFEFSIFPEPLSFGELQIGTDGRTLSAEIELEEDRSYQLVVISKATGFHSVRFSTGEQIAISSIAGRILPPEDLPNNARFIEGESFAVLIEGVGDGEIDDFEDIEENVVAGIPLNGKDFAFEAVYDEDGDGEPDAIELGADERVEVELELLLPEALDVVTLEPALRATGVELETAIVVEFNQPAFLDPEDIFILPPPLQVGDFNESDNGSAYTLEVVLEEDTIYRVIVENAEDEDGGELSHPVETVFTTAEVFPELLSISGRLVLPDLPAARRFEGPIFIGAVPAALLDEGEVGFESFSEEDIVATTITTTADFVLDDVPAGDFLIAAFTRVEVPRGFRAPDPRRRPLRDFDIARQGRFNDQVLEVFDTIELFGLFNGDGGEPKPVAAGEQGIELFLRGESKTRDQILLVTDVLVRGEKLVSDGGLPVVESGDAQIEVRFNKELRSDRGIVAIEANLNGRFLRTFELHEDGKGVTFEAVFDEDHFHRFSLFRAEAKDGAILERPLDIGFTTGESDIGFASVAGHISLETRSDAGDILSDDEADFIDEARVFLFEEDGDELALVGVADVEEDGAFALDEVLPGDYKVFAELLTASGLELKAIFDGDDDGLADVLELDDGDALEDIDIVVTAIIATETDTTTGVAIKTVPPGGNDSATMNLDLDTADGNQSKTTLSNVEVGQQVVVDLYISGATNVNGFAAKLRYDADILDFVSASDQVGSRTNFLRREGGLALFLSPLLREPELEYGGAILGSKETTAPDGDGFMARFIFDVSQEFEGAQVFLEEVTLNSIAGKDVLTPGISAKLAPPVFTEQVKGVFSFDFNSAAGDQEEFHKGFIAAGSVVDVDVYLNLDKVGSDFADLSNYSVTVEFDTEQLTFVNYAPETSEESNLLASAGGFAPQLPAITGTSSITFGSAILGPTAETTPDSSGLVGRLTFATTAAFSETDLLLTNYAVKSVSTAQQDVEMLIIGRMATGEIARVAAGGSSGSGGGAAANAKGSDLDGDGTVGFGDFFLFADAFGKSASEAGAAFDLDGSGTVDFGDFFVFADSFGKAVGKRVVVVEASTVEGRIALDAVSTEKGIKISLQAEKLVLSGYGAVVEFDASAFRLARISDNESALNASGAPALLLSKESDGQVLILGSRTGSRPVVDGLLAELHFEPLSPEAKGTFRVLEASARDGSGRLLQVLNLGQAETRWIPQVFSLAPNYPNPFNPSTTISYQLPLDTQVSLEIYDVLGQKVRTLVSGLKPAGSYLVSWNSRDDMNRQVAAGVYFYRLSAGDFNQVRKLLLLK
ncbi:MAG TPA: T9SS type A sorting domain-containing protein, partial [Candidatus Latescibacteria bacterium]|nr:T9SS type A sorting domain-containing protein [Candidatus Latescibacterota bacterium]